MSMGPGLWVDLELDAAAGPALGGPPGWLNRQRITRQ